MSTPSNGVVYKAPLNLIKNEKKKVESDCLLLSNRIALLKSEMLKAKKKIDETNKKAEIVNNLKLENDLRFKIKSENILAKKNAIDETSIKNEKLKMNININVQKNISKIYDNKLNEASQIKTARQSHNEILEEQRREKQERVEKQRQAVLAAKEAQRIKKEKEEAIKKEAIRIAFEKKIEEEEKARLKKLKEAERLEKEELELIAMLQQTQLEQKKAFSKLEEALNNSKNSFIASARSVATSNSQFLHRDESAARPDNGFSPSTSMTSPRLNLSNSTYTPRDSSMRPNNSSSTPTYK